MCSSHSSGTVHILLRDVLLCTTVTRLMWLDSAVQLGTHIFNKHCCCLRMQRPHPSRARRNLQLAETRSKVAAAAATAAVQLAASQTDSERSSFLAQRMLQNMQAAEQRRLEAQQAQRARLAARNDLIMTRLVGDSCGNFLLVFWLCNIFCYMYAPVALCCIPT